MPHFGYRELLTRRGNGWILGPIEDLLGQGRNLIVHIIGELESLDVTIPVVIGFALQSLNDHIGEEAVILVALQGFLSRLRGVQHLRDLKKPLVVAQLITSSTSLTLSSLTFNP